MPYFTVQSTTDITVQELNPITSFSISASQDQSEIFNTSKNKTIAMCITIIIIYAVPEMFDLSKIVIPNIMNHWEYVAEAFRYKLPTIAAIKEKEHGDPKKCCREFFKDWLTTNNGAKAGPKVWSTLLKVLKEIDEISCDTTKEIITKVKQLNN